MPQITSLSEVAGILQRNRGLDQRDRSLDEAEKRTAALQQREDTRLEMIQGQNDQRTRMATLELTQGLLSLPYQQFRNALPIAAKTGLLDQEDIQSLSALTPEQFPQAKEQLSAATQHFNAITEGFTPDEMSRARRVEAGIEPRAVGNAITTLRETGGGEAVNQFSQDNAAIEGREKAVKDAVDASTDATKQLSQVKRSIQNIDSAIEAIDGGASSGAVASRLPSVRAASIELDNIRGRMGLDIVGATTFGALSEAELRFALDTALPTGLPPTELRAWLERKRDSQSKLAEELEGAAVFLGSGENTGAEYLEFLRSQGGFRAAGEAQDRGVSAMSDEEILVELRGG